MRRMGVLALLMMMAVGALAYGPPATWTDLRELRAEVALLDDSLQSLGAGHPDEAEFRRRENELSQRITWLREELRRDHKDSREGVGASKSEVDSLRSDILALRRDVDTALGRTETSYRESSVPDGTEIAIVIEDELSSKTARPEDPIVASVASSIRVDGRIVIPAGTEVRGIVRNVEPARRPAHGGRLEMSFDSVMIDGRPVGIRSTVVRISEHKLDGSKAGLGALLGGVIGVVAGGKKGLLIGGVVGAAGAVVATKGDEVEIPPGTQVVLRLERPMNLARR